MSTRVERLFCLVQDGQNPLVRQTAAQQIGEMCKMDPSKLDQLLNKSYDLLFNDSWECRTASGQVIEEILKHIPIIYSSNKNEKQSLLPHSFNVQGYDIKKIIKTSKPLVQSNPIQTYLDLFLKHQYIQNELCSLLLLQRIGLITDEQIIKLNQLKSEYLQQINQEQKEKESKNDNDEDDDIQINAKSVSKSSNNKQGESDFDLMKIESYLQKLKESEDEKSKENGNENASNGSKSKSKKLKDEDFKLLMTVRSSLHPKNEISSKKDIKTTENTQCILFMDWYYKLLPFLLHSNWEYRHGAAIGLRSLLKSLSVLNCDNNDIFIEGCLICLSVLLLDKYFDFQSDVTVAPVCETVAQCFSLFMKYIKPKENEKDMVMIIKLLLQCLEIKLPKTWNVRYASCLALKYVLPIHYKAIIELNNFDKKLIENIIVSSCNGMKDDMEDVRNMASQVILSCVSVFIAHSEDKKMTKIQDNIFESLLYALDNIEEYTSATMGVLSVLYSVLDEFPDLMKKYMESQSDIFMNIFNILLKLLGHLSMDMKKQGIKTLYKFIQFVSTMDNDKRIINEKQVISLIETIFDKIMYEQHKYTKESIEVLKENDHDEYQNYLNYKSYVKDLENVWTWICDNFSNLVKINGSQLPSQYQQMILKLFESFQKYATFKKKQDDQHEEEKLPTQELLAKIEEMKNGKKKDKKLDGKGRKRKKMDIDEDENDTQNDMDPPSKKRKLTGNAVENKKSTKDTSGANKAKQQDKKQKNEYQYQQEFVLWGIIDGGCVLLSKLFTCDSFHALGWNIIQYLLLQFLAQQPKQQKNKGKKSKKKKKKKSQQAETPHVVYGWRRVLGCWLLSDCYHQLKRYQVDTEEKQNDGSMGSQIKNVIEKLQKVTHSDIFREYDELKIKRSVIQTQTQRLISTFKNDGDIYKEMSEHFKNLDFTEYSTAVTKQYKEWVSRASTKNANRDGCYQLLLSAVLNSSYNIESEGLMLQCSISHVIINDGDILSEDVNIENVLKPMVTALKDSARKPNLQYRAAECIALVMKMLSDKGGKENEKIIEKLFNNLVADCRENNDYKPKNGTRMVLQNICDLFGEEIFIKLSFIITKIKDALMAINEEAEDEDGDDDQMFSEYEMKMADWKPYAQIYACLISSIKSSEIRDKYLKPLLQPIFKGIYDIEQDEDIEDLYYLDEGICAQARYCILQYLYCQPNVILPMIIKQVIPSLYAESDFDRLGAVELIYNILYSIDSIKSVETQIKQELGVNKKTNKCARFKNYASENLRANQKVLLMEIIPYLSSLIIPLLKGMTDFNDTIRKRANQIFSMSVRLIPLESGLPDPESMSIELKQERVKNQKIMKQLIDPSTITEFKCPFEFKAKLRGYQQDGVNWLWFLHRFHLNGILADDMGLGKTLQTLLIIAASYLYDPAKHQFASTEKKEEDDTEMKVESAKLPSLIVCPATLVWHWPHEINKFIPDLLTPFVIDGKPKKRRALYTKLMELDENDKNHYIAIMSYNTMKNDIEYVNELKWHYTVLDEGHLIKNPKAKMSIAAKSISNKYRLILSGTPIMNSVLDLWSLFDFLMPGYLGDEKWFKRNFSKPIWDSYKSKNANNTTQQRLGALKLEHLHKQVLPFIMRRLKCDVLKELPPKIIQDVEVDMSDIQRMLYKQFVNSGKFDAISTDKNQDKQQLNKQGLQSLLYMRKLVVHPKLVMTRDHPLYSDTIEELQKQNLSLETIDIAPKFQALKSLIEQCNIGGNDNKNKLADSHRILIFVQYTEVIDLIINMLLSEYFPDVKYETLTGKLSNAERFEVVKKFNKDQSIKILLLTVNVGGLGLNLNTADTVIFMEHDWNPMKDLQAMDRAHRIGQTKTVHVFRIIVRNTIEWEIMNKQRFKQHIANTVISSENRSLSSMATGTGSILDLFYMNKAKKGNNDTDDRYEKGGVDNLGEVHNRTKKQKALDQMLDNLTNMSTINEQYQSEYDLKKFISDLNL